MLDIGKSGSLKWIDYSRGGSYFDTITFFLYSPLLPPLHIAGLTNFISFRLVSLFISKFLNLNFKLSFILNL